MNISLVNIKGGCGKSTLATNLAAGFAARKQKVGLVDTDSQGTAFNWIAQRSETSLKVPHIAFSCLPKPELLKKQIGDMEKICDTIVIDGTPGKDSMTLNTSVISLSDVVIVPVNPSMSDLWATLLTVEKIREVSQYKKFKAFCLINRQVKNSKALAETMNLLNEEDVFSVIPLLDSRITSYVSFVDVLGEGLGMIEAKNKNPQAAKEIEKLVTEIIKRSKES